MVVDAERVKATVPIHLCDNCGMQIGLPDDGRSLHPLVAAFWVGVNKGVFRESLLADGTIGNSD